MKQKKKHLIAEHFLFQQTGICTSSQSMSDAAAIEDYEIFKGDTNCIPISLSLDPRSITRLELEQKPEF